MIDYDHFIVLAETKFIITLLYSTFVFLVEVYAILGCNLL